MPRTDLMDKEIASASSGPVGLYCLEILAFAAMVVHNPSASNYVYVRVRIHRKKF